MSIDPKALKALAKVTAENTAKVKQEVQEKRALRQAQQPVAEEPKPIVASQIERVYRNLMEEVYPHVRVDPWKGKEITQAKKLIERYPRDCIKIVEWGIRQWEAYAVTGWVKGALCIGNILVNADRFCQDQQENLTPVQRKIALQDQVRRERDKWREFQGGTNPLEGEHHEQEITADEIDW